MDRNAHLGNHQPLPVSSLSARRAWIEIHCVISCVDFRWVALRKESVDRNLFGMMDGA